MANAEKISVLPMADPSYAGVAPANTEAGATELVTRKGIQSVDVGYKLLHALQVSDRPLSLTALSEATGMTPSKCHGYLSSFLRVGLIAQKESGGLYDLGPSALQLGLTALERIDALQEAREAMVELRERLQETIVLSIWGNHGPTIVYKQEGPRWSPLSVRVGTVLPVLSATGLVLLSDRQREAVEALIAKEWEATPSDSPWKVDSVEEIHALLERVRVKRIAKGRGNIFPGYSGICSPIYDHEGSVCAALMVMGEVPQFDRSENGVNAGVLRRAAEAVSRRIGWRGKSDKK
ncbi:IclR family transcriptional regulator [Pusillimonas sp.]|uniref:IclR family transcriptional regulator n=1 Tax=Pusillimonas sp. TaxID=3040095 RepID=UPI0029A46AF5|nr:IclR family transcriptional regulator [Pusillimonas sp.]MDX3896245.1 IclR family transcriptional regulator [Pusillimonas sp.]